MDGVRWRTLVSRMRGAAASARGRLKVRQEPWTERSFGRAATSMGCALIAGALVFGWVSVTGERVARSEQVVLAATTVFCRAALAATFAWVGYAVLKLGERRLFSRTGSPSKARGLQPRTEGSA